MRRVYEYQRWHIVKKDDEKALAGGRTDHFSNILTDRGNFRQSMPVFFVFSFFMLLLAVFMYVAHIYIFLSLPYGE